MSVTLSPPKPVDVFVDYTTTDKSDYAPKKITASPRMYERKNLAKIASHYVLSPVRPIVEETDIDDLLGAEDEAADKVIIDCIVKEDGTQVFLFDNGTYIVV